MGQVSVAYGRLDAAVPEPPARFPTRGDDPAYPRVLQVVDRAEDAPPEIATEGFQRVVAAGPRENCREILSWNGFGKKADAFVIFIKEIEDDSELMENGFVSPLIETIMVRRKVKGQRSGRSPRSRSPRR